MRLEIGTRRPLLLREEEVGDGAAEAWRLLYASDLHLHARRRHLVDQLRDVAARAQPEAVLLGGDLIDCAAGLPVLADAVAMLAAYAPVLAVPGNHDAFVGAGRVRTAVLGAGGAWLPDAQCAWRADGRRRLELHARPRQDAARDSIRVLVGHDPRVSTAASACGYDLVLAGHLHGGQCVLFARNGRLYPAAWFYRWNGLRFRERDTTVLVSRGVADTLPVRFRCPREVLLCRVR